MQATVNSVALDDGSTRFIRGAVSDTIGEDNQRVVVVPFFLEGTSEEDLQTNYATVLSTFRTRNKVVTITLDSGASNKMVSIGPDDGKHLNVVTAVEPNNDFEPTGLSLPLLLIVVAEATNPLALYTGLNSFTKEVEESAGRATIRVVSGQFVSTSGKTGQDNYDDNRATLLTDHLLVDATGARDATSKMVLTDERTVDQDGEGRAVAFSLTAKYEPFAWSGTASARGAQLAIVTHAPAEWPAAAVAAFPAFAVEKRPTLVQVEGTVAISEDVLATGIGTIWSSVEADVIAAIAQETGSASLKRLNKSLAIDAAERVLSFTANYQTGKALLAYESVTTITTRTKVASWTDSDGFDYEQESPNSPVVMHEVVASRKGLGLKNVTTMVAPRPTRSGFEMRFLSSENAHRGPFTSDFGNNVYEQTVRALWVERRFRKVVGQLQSPALPIVVP